MSGPLIWLMLALAASGPATYGVMVIKQHRIEVAAYEAGKAVGAQSVAATVTASATGTANRVAEGEASVEPISPTRAAIIAACNRSASCRDRTK